MYAFTDLIRRLEDYVTTPSVVSERGGGEYERKGERERGVGRGGWGARESLR